MRGAGLVDVTEADIATPKVQRRIFHRPSLPRDSFRPVIVREGSEQVE
jgi:hypothetical protein